MKGTTDYRVIAWGKARRFEITGGLRKGYGVDDPDATVYGVTEVIAAHHAWQRETGTVFGALIQPATVSYGWPEGGAVRTDSEPGFVLFGTVNVLYPKDELDGMVLYRLRSLALFIAAWLDQTRMYLEYDGISEILERTGDGAS